MDAEQQSLRPTPGFNGGLNALFLDGFFKVKDSGCFGCRALFFKLGASSPVPAGAFLYPEIVLFFV